MKKLFLLFIFIIFSFGVGSDRALQIYINKHKNEKKIALVIGNGNYIKFQPLKNALNDARDVKNALEKIGFKVIFGENLTRKQIKRKIRVFENMLNKNSVALFYYAGHGIEVENKNYLVPLKSDIIDKIDVPDEAVSLNRIIRGMKKARLKIVVIDACRNDPFSRGIETHFAPLNADGTIIAFGTSSGDTASENPNDKNGLFTKYFLKTLQIPNLNQVEFFRTIRKEVYLHSNKRQKPALYDETIGDFYFNIKKVHKTKSKYTNNNFHTVVNPVTLVMWQNEVYINEEVDKKTNYGKIGNWDYANEYCKNLKYKGYTNWRLPSIKELKSLASDKYYVLNSGFYIYMKRVFIPSVQNLKVITSFWTNENDKTGAWVFDYSSKNKEYFSKNTYHYIRCIRNMVEEK